MAPVSDAPTSEAGYAAGVAPLYGIGQTSSSGFYVEGLDDNVDLRFPYSAVIYDRMRKEDGQVGSVLRAITLPLLGARWHLDTTGVRPAVARFVEAELGLGDNMARRRRQGIVWREHLRHALLMLPLGFMPFEQVYTVGAAAPGLEDPEQPGRLYAHLRKLGPRMPRSLLEVRVDRDGGLAGIVQNPPASATGREAIEGVFLDVDRLVMYVNDREGAEWTGTSVLRTAYKHWLIKDALLRMGPQVVERNGMGIPVVTYPQNGDRARALEIATAARAGSTAGVALEEGMTFALVGVTGSLRDELPLVEYHDRATSRALLAMFLDLGHDGGLGHGSIGETFLDVFRKSLGAVVANVQDTATEHIIRDLVDLNYGPDEPYPSLVCDDLTDAELEATSLKALTDAGLITPDADLETFIRDRRGLPPKPPAGDKVADAAASPFASVGLPALVSGGIMGPEEARQLLGLPPGAPVPATPAPQRVPPQLVTAASAGDALVDRLAELTERIAALRA